MVKHGRSHGRLLADAPSPDAGELWAKLRLIRPLNAPATRLQGGFSR